MSSKLDDNACCGKCIYGIPVHISCVCCRIDCSLKKELVSIGDVCDKFRRRE